MGGDQGSHETRQKVGSVKYIRLNDASTGLMFWVNSAYVRAFGTDAQGNNWIGIGDEPDMTIQQSPEQVIAQL